MAAMNTARFIVKDGDLQKALIGLPIFMHAMIAVCASFLLKMAVVFGKSDSTTGIDGDGTTLHLPKDLSQYGLNFHTKTALDNVERLVRVLSQVADNASQRHVVRQVVTGLGELLQRFSPNRATEGQTFLYYVPRNKDPVTLPVKNASRDPLLLQRQNGGIGVDYSYPDIPENEGNASNDPVQVDNITRQPDPFDLTGDLDWRFDDGFLFGIEIIDSELAFL
jgi:hypothetical protein